MKLISVKNSDGQGAQMYDEKQKGHIMSNTTILKACDSGSH
jgi:hypothetical protein